MNYVPGYHYDVFVSYAHLDDRGWIDRFLDHLKREIRVRLGVEPCFWMDDRSLKTDVDFQMEIPDSVQTSALFLMLASPSYVRSQYCVKKECPAFRNTLETRRARFQTADLGQSQFALSCPIVAVDDDEHRSLFDNLTDIFFCDKQETYAIGTPKFAESLSKLVGESVRLLRAMRHHSTPVFLYPQTPSPDLQKAHQHLKSELTAGGFRILPDREVKLEDQLRDASLSVFLLGPTFDEEARRLASVAKKLNNRWIVWRSPEAAETGDDKQLAFADELLENDPTYMAFLPPQTTPVKLKEQVFASLRPDPTPVPTEKPRIYLNFNLKHNVDRAKAGRIRLAYENEFEFEGPDNPALRGSRLTKSDGVLLVWGTADSEWCLGEFQAMLQTARSRNRGLCVFDPKETKESIIQQIRQSATDFYIAEEFGSFDPEKLTSFFESIRETKLAALKDSSPQGKGALSTGQ